MAGVAATVAVGAIVVGGAIKAYGGYKDKKKAKNKQKAAEGALVEAQNDLKNVDTSNPFEDAKNAYAGLEIKWAVLKMFMKSKRTFTMTWKIK